MALTPSPAVVRAADLLGHLAQHPTDGFTVSELARQLGVPRATCDSLLLGLAERGFVRRDSALRYELGPACIVLGDAARAANPALRASEAHAETLARTNHAVAAVSIRDRTDTRVTHVFDFGPPFGIRARVGEAIRLGVPFGASFVAWDDDAAIDRWLAAADPPLSNDEVTRYRAALDAVRRRGYSVTIMTARNPTLVAALERGDDAGRRTRDEVARAMTHSEYLPAELEPGRPIRLAQVSAPVFESDGAVAASIMLLGPSHEVTAAEIADLGARVVAAADAATADIHGISPRDTRSQ